jgi:hypothetical protein
MYVFDVCMYLMYACMQVYVHMCTCMAFLPCAAQLHDVVWCKIAMTVTVILKQMKIGRRCVKITILEHTHACT